MLNNDSHANYMLQKWLFNIENLLKFPILLIIIIIGSKKSIFVYKGLYESVINREIVAGNKLNLNFFGYYKLIWIYVPLIFTSLILITNKNLVSNDL